MNKINQFIEKNKAGTSVLAWLLILVFVALFRFYLPDRVSEFASDFIASTALAVVLIKEFIYKSPKLTAKYNIDPKELTNSSLSEYIDLKVNINNMGELPINITPRWIDDWSNNRYEPDLVMDYKGNPIDKTVNVDPNSEKEVIIRFLIPKVNYISDMEDALKTKDLRILGEYKNLSGRIVWSDGRASSSQQKAINLGMLLFTLVTRLIKDKPQFL